MCHEEVTSSRCSSLSIKRNGKTAKQKQRYLCKDCRRQFITHYTYRGCQGALHALIVPMALNGHGACSQREPKHSMANDRTAAAQVPEPDLPCRVQDLEIDEFWSFIRQKSDNSGDGMVGISNAKRLRP